MTDSKKTVNDSKKTEQQFSNDVSAVEAIERIENGTFKEAQAFLASDEDRATVQDAYGLKRHSRSNKAAVYIAFKNGERDIEKLHSECDKAVKQSTIKGWTNSWKRGKENKLPAVARYYSPIEA
jgi:hypothetical protein